MAQSGAGVNGHAQEPVTISIRADAGQRDPSIKRRTDWAAAGQTSCSKPQHQVAGLARPAVGGVLADAFDVQQAAAGQLRTQLGMALRVLSATARAAVRVAGGDVGGMALAVARQQGRQLRAFLPDAQRERVLTTHAVVRLAVRLDGCSVDARRKQISPP